MTKLVVVALDPGKTTGVAVFYGGLVTTHEVDHASVANLVGWHIHEALDRKADLRVVSELFTISARTTKTKVQYESLYLNGWLVYGPAAEYVEFQTPAQAKSLATNKRLEALGWRRPSKGGHADDAARHLFTYLHKNNLAPELLAPAFEDVKEFD